MESTDLVPGDVVHICDDMDLPADMLLVTGEALVVEAALTGEPFPVVKARGARNCGAMNYAVDAAFPSVISPCSQGARSRAFQRNELCY